jgi:hypothetical protein
LLPGKKRVTVGANFDPDIFFGGTSLNYVPASTGDGCFDIVGVNSGFHFFSLKSGAL